MVDHWFTSSTIYRFSSYSILMHRQMLFYLLLMFTTDYKVINKHHGSTLCLPLLTSINVHTHLNQENSLLTPGVSLPKPWTPMSSTCSHQSWCSHSLFCTTLIYTSATPDPILPFFSGNQSHALCRSIRPFDPFCHVLLAFNWCAMTETTCCSISSKTFPFPNAVTY